MVKVTSSSSRKLYKKYLTKKNKFKKINKIFIDIYLYYFYFLSLFLFSL